MCSCARGLLHPLPYQVLNCEAAAAEASTAERGLRTALLGAQQRLSESLQIATAFGHHLREVRGDWRHLLQLVC